MSTITQEYNKLIAENKRLRAKNESLSKETSLLASQVGGLDAENDEFRASFYQELKRKNAVIALLREARDTWAELKVTCDMDVTRIYFWDKAEDLSNRIDKVLNPNETK